MADRDSEPKPFGKGLLDGNLGATTRAGRIRVLEGLIADLEASIRPVQERLAALRGVVEQERDALFMDERRAQRARERTDGAARPGGPEQKPSAAAAKERPLAHAAGAGATTPQYPAESGGAGAEPSARS
jgi:hypothetical protein